MNHKPKLKYCYCLECQRDYEKNNARQLKELCATVVRVEREIFTDAKRRATEAS